MAKKSPEKAIGYATIAIALAAAIQGLNGFNQYRANMEKDWTALLLLIVVGVFVILIFTTAFKAFQYMIKE